jgi:hypothetical protein
MNQLTYQRCANHAGREAVARCPDCKRFFCRECVTEHEDRVLCSSCLSRRIQKKAQKRYRGIVKLLPLAIGFLTAWLFFYWLGEGLLFLPSSFHEGTFWQTLGAIK